MSSATIVPLRNTLALRLLRGRGAPALFDQILISGANFLANIVLVRGLGLHEFGKYSIAYILLLYANGTQMSFVTQPMLSVAPLLDGTDRRAFINGMLTIQLMASSILCLVFALAGMTLRIFNPFYSLSAVCAIALSVGAFQLQDWLRRYYFLVNKTKLAIVSDFISYVLQLIVLVVLWRTGHLTLTSAFITIFTTSMAAIVMGPLTDRFHPTIRHLGKAWGRCRILSRDLVIAEQVRWFGLQGLLLFASNIVGVAEAGGLRATQGLAGPVNLVITSFENVVPIRVAEELKSNGANSAMKYAARVISTCLLVFGPLILVIAFTGRPLLRLLFGPALLMFYVPMVLQLVIVLAQIVTRIWNHLFRGLQDSRALLWGNALSTAGCLIPVYSFGRAWGATGIVLASLCGQLVLIIFCVIRWRSMRLHYEELYPECSQVRCTGEFQQI